MWRSRRVLGWSALALASVMLSGCACGATACPAPVAEVTGPASPGATVTVELSQLWDCATPRLFTCGVRVLSEVRVDLVPASDPNAPVDTATVAVASDATAIAELTLPEDADGAYFVTHDMAVLDTITVTPD